MKATHNTAEKLCVFLEWCTGAGITFDPRIEIRHRGTDGHVEDGEEDCVDGFGVFTKDAAVYLSARETGM